MIQNKSLKDMAVEGLLDPYVVIDVDEKTLSISAI